MSIEQKRALALASARVRAQSVAPAVGPEKPKPDAFGLDEVVGNPITRFALGAASPIIGASQFMSQGAGKVAEFLGASPETVAAASASPFNQKELEASKKRGMEARDDGEFDAAGLAGNVLNPVGLKIMKAPVAATLPGRMREGAAIGTVMAGTQPTDEGDGFFERKGVQAVTGALLGGLMPVAIDTVKAGANAAYRAVEPMFEKGREAILRRYQDSLLGSDSVRQKVAQALQGARELVPGSRPTAAEAISDIPEATGLAAHQASIAKQPGVSGQFVARDAEQEAARRAAIQGIGKDKATLQAAEAARSAASKQNYGAAYAQAVQADPKLAALSKNPYYQDALPDAIKLAEARGIDPKQNVTEFLHFVKLSLDKQLAKTGDTALSSTEQKAVGDLQRQLVGWLGEKNPAYEGARAAHAAASKPINAMQVGQELEKALTDPATGGERARVFATAATNAPRTIKNATGRNMGFDDLGDVLPPQQKAVVDAVLADLQRGGKADKLAKGTNVYGGTALAERGDTAQLPNLLSRPAAVANFIMKKFGQGADEKINALAAKQYLDPQALAHALRDIPQSRRAAVIEAIIQRSNVPAAVVAGDQVE